MKAFKNIKRTPENTKDVFSLNLYQEKLKQCKKRNDKAGIQHWNLKIQLLSFK